MQILVDLGGNTEIVHISGNENSQSLAQMLAADVGPRLAPDEIWFQHKGRPLREDKSLGAAGVRQGSLLTAHLRVRGGGGDGGATGAESRSSYLEMYMSKKPDKVNPAEEKLAKWTTCKLSGQKLEPPCVVDELGSLYNKEAVVTALVTKSMPKALSHISSLKHVQAAVLSRAADSRPSSQADARNFQPGNEAEFCCPVSGQPLNGQYRFCALFPSGHIVGEKAVKQVPVAVEELIGSRWKEAIPLNGSQEEVEALWDRLIAKRNSKKPKKEKRQALAVPKGEAKVSGDGRSSSGDSPTNTTEDQEKLERKRPVQDFSITEKLHAKKLKAADMAPANADKKVWASLFTSTHGKAAKETYACRSTSGRGWI